MKSATSLAGEQLSSLPQDMEAEFIDIEGPGATN
jgi:hypothetical protein